MTLLEDEREAALDEFVRGPGGTQREWVKVLNDMAAREKAVDKYMAKRENAAPLSRLRLYLSTYLTAPQDDYDVQTEPYVETWVPDLSERPRQGKERSNVLVRIDPR